MSYDQMTADILRQIRYLQARLEVAQRMADSIRRISNEAEVFGGGFGEWIRDQAANALAEWESTK